MVVVGCLRDVGCSTSGLRTAISRIPALLKWSLLDRFVGVSGPGLERAKADARGRARVLHLYDFATTGRLDPDAVDLSRIKHQWQPIFVAHPETGRTALYVNRLMSARIEGLPRHESEVILEELFAIAEDPAHHL